MEKKNILPELKKQLPFVIEYKLFRDSEVTIAVWSLIFTQCSKSAFNLLMASLLFYHLSENYCKQGREVPFILCRLMDSLFGNPEC
jgi:hypothetical protein